MKKSVMKTLNVLIPTIAASTIVIPPTALAINEWLNPKGMFDAQAREFKKLAVEEFLEICNHPHPTFGTRQICSYIEEELEKLGYEETESIAELDNGLHYLEDDYKTDGTVYPVEDSSGNLYFQIPATEGRENSTAITLQAHMDMVLDGISREEGLNVKIDPVIDGNTIHTRDFKTSLGADDGIGVAAILALAKHPDIVAHGPLRCIITADEEDGISGASVVPYEALKNNYIINLDDETYNNITISAAGTIDKTFQLNKIRSNFIQTLSQSVIDRTHEYEITVSGLLGGHSATEINKGKASAIQLVSDIAIGIKNLSPVGSDLMLVSMKADNLANAICKEAKMKIISSLSYDEWIKPLLEMKYDRYIKSHPIETGLTINCEEISKQSRSHTALSLDGTKNIIELIPTLPFGPLSWLDIDHKEVETSMNLSTLKLDLSAAGTTTDPQFTIESLARSSNQASLSFIDSYFRSQANDYLQAMLTDDYDKKVEPIHLDASSPSWEPINDAEYWKFVTAAMKDAGIKGIRRFNCHGWLELGCFWEKYHDKDTPHIISIGATIENCHSCMETFYLDTYQPFLQSLLYILNLIDDFAK